jgi:hypothetical protein
VPSATPAATPSRHQQHQLDVVRADRRIAVAERGDGDLLALQRDPSHHVQQKAATPRKMAGNTGHGLQLLQFLGEEAVGELVAAGIGTDAAVGRQQGVEAVDDRLLVAARGEGERHAVEGAVHVIGRGQGMAAHPQHAVALEVRKHGAGRDLVDIFRRQGHAHQGQGLALAVDDGGERVAG